MGAVFVHGTADLTVPAAQSRRLAAALASRLGRDAVYAVYPHGCKHADDRLYREKILETVEIKIRRCYDRER